VLAAVEFCDWSCALQAGARNIRRLTAMRALATFVEKANPDGMVDITPFDRKIELMFLASATATHDYENESSAKGATEYVVPCVNKS
jgi:hypothetical protein